MIQQILNYQKFLYYILLSSIVMSQEPEDTLALDLDKMWDEVEWVDPSDFEIIDSYQEVEYITATAGVRGKESEDEILQYLYYRKRAKR